MMDTLPTREWTVERVLQCFPQSAQVFLRLKTDCVGCMLQKFCTLEEVGRDYGLVLNEFLAALNESIQSKNPEE